MSILDAEQEGAEGSADAAQPLLPWSELSPRQQAEHCTTELLCFLSAAALEQITSAGYLEEDVRWCITVPAMFNDRQRAAMRQAATAAGLSAEDGKLVLALEPEAAAHYARVSGTRLGGGGEAGSQDLTAPGVQIAVVDSGGGTVDLATYENDENGRMIEIGKVNGARLGSNELNLRFEDRILADRFGKPELVAQLRAEVPEAMLDLHEAWERAKLSFGPDSREPIPLPLPTAIDRRLGATVRKRLARKQHGKTDAIIVSPEEVRELFDTVVPDILDLIDEQLDEAEMRRPADAPMPVVLLAGGFGNSPYLQHAVKEHVRDRAVVLIPPDPATAVLVGAMHFAYEPQTRARRSRFTYGASTSMEFVAGTDPEEYRFVASDGRVRCNRRFAKLVTRGDIVDTEKASRETFLPLEGDQKNIQFTLYSSTEDNPRYVTDPGCERIGTITISLGKVMHLAQPDREVELRMHFGETEIKVSAVVKKSGEEASTKMHFASDY
ncbi:Hsp70 family protein [Streptomyces jumonjinensis]|uniref:Hsp70 family protein n=1 Tax=Streptomyces jumonjinensis TaxID=1945 RepID=UPI0037A83E5B